MRYINLHLHYITLQIPASPRNWNVVVCILKVSRNICDGFAAEKRSRHFRALTLTFNILIFDWLAYMSTRRAKGVQNKKVMFNFTCIIVNFL